MDRRNLLKAMGAAAMMPMAMDAEAAPPSDDTVYELRIYHLNEGKQDLILERFRSGETKLFEKHGMHGVAYWTATDEPLAGRTLIYMLRHKSHEAATASWAAFAKDPDWLALKTASEKDGVFVNKHESTFMKRTDFSPKL